MTSELGLLANQVELVEYKPTTATQNELDTFAIRGEQNN